ncbi:hypothetical protein CSOJ01_04630 [Colletotrichum sojae]|uniref:Uncharacterized protein n=1 Tax=Colletotrichum sojae TaxID=2175907 RepID=A0A8H6JIY1_9PEZI|nr:hypothetical protein CSOJ01_04630 [Colletotrichum sojae]
MDRQPHAGGGVDAAPRGRHRLLLAPSQHWQVRGLRPNFERNTAQTAPTAPPSQQNWSATVALPRGLHRHRAADGDERRP